MGLLKYEYILLYIEFGDDGLFSYDPSMRLLLSRAKPSDTFKRHFERNENPQKALKVNFTSLNSFLLYNILHFSCWWPDTIPYKKQKDNRNLYIGYRMRCKWKLEFDLKFSNLIFECWLVEWTFTFWVFKSERKCLPRR